MERCIQQALLRFIDLILGVLVKNSAAVLTHPLKVIPARAKAVDTSVLKRLVVAKPIIELVKTHWLICRSIRHPPLLDHPFGGFHEEVSSNPLEQQYVLLAVDFDKGLAQIR